MPLLFSASIVIHRECAFQLSVQHPFPNLSSPSSCLPRHLLAGNPGQIDLVDRSQDQGVPLSLLAFAAFDLEIKLASSQAMFVAASIPAATCISSDSLISRLSYTPVKHEVSLQFPRLANFRFSVWPFLPFGWRANLSTSSKRTCALDSTCELQLCGLWVGLRGPDV